MLRHAEQRVRVVDEARTWLGTPYHHRARIKGAGVDCAQILAAVYEAAGLVPPLDLGEYATQWHLHRSEEQYLGWLQRCGARPIPVGAWPLPGDIGVWQFGRTYSHGGIVMQGGPDPHILHAYVDRGVILTRAADDPLCGRLHRYWSIISEA